MQRLSLRRVAAAARAPTFVALAAAITIVLGATPASGARPVVDVSFGTGTVHGIVSLAVQKTTGDLFVYEDWPAPGCTYQAHIDIWHPDGSSGGQIEYPSVYMPNCAYGGDFDFIDELDADGVESICGTTVPVGSLLVSQSPDNYLYVLDPSQPLTPANIIAGPFTVPASSGTLPGGPASSDAEGVAYDPRLQRVWVVHWKDNEVDELAADCTANDAHFSTAPAGTTNPFGVWWGDIDVDAQSGNLVLATNAASYNTTYLLRELTPAGAWVRDVSTGVAATGLALEDDHPGEGWVSTLDACGCPPTKTNLYHLTGIGVTVSLGDVTVYEGNSGVTTASIPVTLSVPSAQKVVVHYQTIDGSATVYDGDYTEVAAGKLVIPKGKVFGTIKLSVTGDTNAGDAANEDFSVHVTSVVGARLVDTQDATVTIADDDAVPGTKQVAIGDVTVAEGDVLQTASKVTLTLSDPAPVDGVDVHVGTRCNPSFCTATPGDDYLKHGAVVTIPEGETTGFFTVRTVGQSYDTLPPRPPEVDETFGVKITNIHTQSDSGWTARDDEGLVTIREDD